MTTPRDESALRYALDHLQAVRSEMQDRVQEARQQAGFHALEALESDNRAEDCRERASRLSVRASAYLEVVAIVEDRIASIKSQHPRTHLET